MKRITASTLVLITTLGIDFAANWHDVQSDGWDSTASLAAGVWVVCLIWPASPEPKETRP